VGAVEWLRSQRRKHDPVRHLVSSRIAWVVSGLSSFTLCRRTAFKACVRGTLAPADGNGESPSPQPDMEVGVSLIVVHGPGG
jgi:hypothetical protein